MTFLSGLDTHSLTESHVDPPSWTFGQGASGFDLARFRFRWRCRRRSQVRPHPVYVPANSIRFDIRLLFALAC